MILSTIQQSHPLVETVLARLKGVRISLRGWVACCPAHSDREPSLSTVSYTHLTLPTIYSV